MTNEIVIVPVPEFKTDEPALEGAAFVFQCPTEQCTRLDSARFKAASYAYLDTITGGTIRSWIDRMYELIETKAKLELAEATISTLRAENEQLHEFAGVNETAFIQIHQYITQIKNALPGVAQVIRSYLPNPVGEDADADQRFSKPMPEFDFPVLDKNTMIALPCNSDGEWTTLTKSEAKAYAARLLRLANELP